MIRRYSQIPGAHRAKILRRLTNEQIAVGLIEGLIVEQDGFLIPAVSGAAPPVLVQELGKAQNAVGATTIVVTLAANATASNLVVIRAAGDGGHVVSSVADSRTNTWLVDKSHATGPKCSICSTGQNAGTLQSGDTVTVTYDVSTTAKMAVVDEFSGCDTSASRVRATQSSTATTTNRDAGTVASSSGDLVVCAYSLGATETSFTQGTGFSNFTTRFHGPAGTSVEGQYRVGAGSDTTAATGGVSSASNGIAVAYKPSAATVVASLLSLLGVG